MSAVSYEFDSSYLPKIFSCTTTEMYEKLNLLECPLILRILRSEAGDLDILQKRIVVGVKKLVAELNKELENESGH